MRKKVPQLRLFVVLGGILLLLTTVTWRIFDIAYNRHEWYSQTALAQASGAANILLRGNIYLTEGPREQFLAVTNRKFTALAINASALDANTRQETVAQLAQITGVSPEVIAKAANSELSGPRVVVHRLKDEQANAIRALNAPGVSLISETDRSYPAGTLAAEAIGFLGYGASGGRQGQYGIEGIYDDELAGRTTVGTASRWNVFSQLKRLIGMGASETDRSDDRPQDIHLTIDKNIQAYAQDALGKVLEKYSASGGVIIVQEPTTGRILAMADSPTFDPNTYSTFPVESFGNGALQAFEPGSSFKPFTMAMGLDLNKITPNSTFNDESDIIVDGYTIKNFNEQHFGRVTMAQVLEKSINTGTMYVQSLLSNDQFLNYMINTGFGQKTDIDLPGEASGDVNNLYTGRRINFMTASFGQGIAVTPIQLINAYSAIANGGKLMRPYVTASITDEHGESVATTPEVIGTPFTAKTAAALRTMLTSVVDNGFDKARIPRYDVAGKTGTAQIADPEKGGYLEKQYNHTFVGFAPASDPKFVVLIKMERPQGITFAADSLSPTFKDVALFLLNYLNIPPTR